MKLVKYSNVLLMLFVLFALTFSACTTRTPLLQQSPVTVLGTVADSDASTITHAKIILAKGKQKVEEVVPVKNNEFSATLQVPVGEWELQILLMDSEGKVEFQSKTEKTNVSLGKRNTVDLLLRPADSEVSVRVNLDNYLFRDLAMRARIHFDDEVHEIIRPDLQTPLEKTILLSPGSYEFKIELYTESFRVGDRLGLGVWDVIHIDKNKEVIIDWSPESEQLQISGQVATLLPAPQNLKIKQQQNQLSITWDPVTHSECAGYFLFAQTSLLDRYELLSSLPLTRAEYQHDLENDETPEEIRYVVAAVSNGGLVGYYSDVQSYKP